MVLIVVFSANILKSVVLRHKITLNLKSNKWNRQSITPHLLTV